MTKEERNMVAEARRQFNFIVNYDPTKGGQLNERVNILNEDKFSRKIGDIIKANIPRIKTFAILTSQNPRSQQASNEYNENAMKKLEDDLIQGKFGFREVEGMFDNPETSYFIPNIPKSTAMDLGAKYHQTSIIHGEIKTKKDGSTYADMSEIYTTGKGLGKVKHKSQVFIELPNAENYYSKAYGKKFTIPFTRYTTDMKHAEWKDKETGIIPNKNNVLFDKYGNEISIENISENILFKIEALSKKSLNEEITGRRRWECRAEIDSLLYQYRKIR